MTEEATAERESGVDVAAETERPPLPEEYAEKIRRLSERAKADPAEVEEAFWTLLGAEEDPRLAFLVLEALEPYAAEHGWIEVSWMAAGMRKAHDRKRAAEEAGAEVAAALLSRLRELSARDPVEAATAALMRGAAAVLDHTGADLPFAEDLLARAERAWGAGRPSGVAEATALAVTISENYRDKPHVAYREARKVGEDTIEVPGGARGPRLPPAAPEPGTVDPALEAMVREGATAYHLSTLRDLEAEARAATETLLGLAEGTFILPAESGSAVPLRGYYEREKERFASTRFDAPSRKPCGYAGCRTLGDCLCSCRSCRVACRDRKPA